MWGLRWAAFGSSIPFVRVKYYNSLGEGLSCAVTSGHRFRFGPWSCAAAVLAGLFAAGTARAALVTRFSFDTTSGGTASTDSIAGITGTVKGTGGTISGGSLNLSGNSAYFDMGNATTGVGATIGTLTNCTVETWFTVNGTPNSWMRVFDFGNAAGKNWFYAPICGNDRVSINTGSGEQQINGANLAKGGTVYAAVTYQQVGATYTGTLYINGALVASTTGLTYTPSSLGATSNNYLGKSQYANPYFNGSINDFRIWNTALSPTQITADYNAGADGIAVWNGSGDFTANNTNWDTQVSPTGNVMACVQSGALAISTAQNYWGGTLIQGGSTSLGSLGTMGSNISTNIVTLGGGILSLACSANNIGNLQPITFAGGTLQYTAISAAAGATDYSGQIQNGTAPIIVNVAGGQSVTFGSSLAASNTAGLTKIDSGTLALTASNSYSGVTTLSGGVLQVGNAAALSTGNITFAGGSLQFAVSNDYSSRIKNSTGPVSLDTYTQPSLGLANPIDSSNTGGLSKAGSGILTLNGNNTYTGPTTISAGTLSLGAAANLGGGNYSASIVNNGVLAVNTGNNQTFSGAISGGGGLLQNGSGMTTLSAVNSYSGGTTLAGGTLGVNGDFAFGAAPSPAATNITFTNSAALQANGVVVLNANRNIAVNSGATATLNTNGNSMVVGGAISGSGGVNKTGAGTLTLAGENTYSGPTTIAAGTLEVANATTAAAPLNFNFSSGTNTNSGTTTVTLANGGTPVYSATGGPVAGLGVLSLNGTSYLDIQATSLPNLSGNNNNAYTIGMWIQTTTQGATYLTKGAVGSTWGGNDQTFYLTTGVGSGGGGTGTHVGGVQYGGGWVGGNTSVNTGNWTFISIVRSAGISTVYVNGVADGTSNGMASAEQGTQDIRLGWSWTDDGSKPFTGNISGTYVYGSALNASQIQALMLAGPGATVAGGLSANSPIQLTASGAGLDLNGSSQTIPSLSGVAGTNVYLGGGALTLGSDNSNQTFSGNIADAGGVGTGTGGSLTKAGSGSFTLAGNNSYTGNTNVNAGAFAFSGTANTGAASGNTNTGMLNVANAASSVGTVNFQPGASVTVQSLYLGNASNAVGVVNQTGGNVTFNGGTVWPFEIGQAGGSYGVYRLSGGAVTASEMEIGNYGFGVFNQTGGQATITNWVILGRNNGANSGGVMNVSGGTFTYTGAGGGHFDPGWTGQPAQINVSGSGLLDTQTKPIEFGLYGGGPGGMVNLSGGTLRTAGFNGYTAPNSYLNFNGGTLKASGSTTAWFTNMKGVYVYPGGGTIDDGGNAVTFNQAILAPTGSGVTSIPVTAQGTGYTDAPVVVLTGGGGSGATAVAVISGGSLTGFTITNPGVGYTSAPTVNLYGGGGTAPTLAAATLGLNSATGGLTKTGLGMLTLSASNNYGGQTTVNAGTLALGAAGAIKQSSTIFVNSGATFDGSAVTNGFQLAGGQTLAGFGTINGNLATQLGSLIAAGSGSSYGTLGFNNGLNIGGGTLQFKLGTPNNPGGVSSDLLNVAGALGGTGTATISFSPQANFASGTYDLINFGSKTLTLANFSAPQTVNGLQAAYSLTASQLDMTLFNVSGPIWASQTGGTWSTATNWSGNNVPNGAGQSANFLTTLAASDTVVLDVPVTLGTLNFNNAAASYTLGSVGSTNALTLDNTGSVANITLAAGSHAIQAPVVLNGPTSVAVSDPAMSLTIGGNISGVGSLTMGGPGTLVLAGSNSYAGTVVSGGTLQTTAAGALPAAPLNVNAGVLDLGATTQTAGTVGIAGGVVQNGVLSGTNFAISGGLLAAGGTLSTGGTFTVTGGFDRRHPGRRRLAPEDRRLDVRPQYAEHLCRRHHDQRRSAQHQCRRRPGRIERRRDLHEQRHAPGEHGRNHAQLGPGRHNQQRRHGHHRHAGLRHGHRRRDWRRGQPDQDRQRRPHAQQREHLQRRHDLDRRRWSLPIRRPWAQAPPPTPSRSTAASSTWLPTPRSPPTTSPSAATPPFSATRQRRPLRELCTTWAG